MDFESFEKSTEALSAQLRATAAASDEFAADAKRTHAALEAARIEGKELKSERDDLAIRAEELAAAVLQRDAILDASSREILAAKEAAALAEARAMALLGAAERSRDFDKVKEEKIATLTEALNDALARAVAFETRVEAAETLAAELDAKRSELEAKYAELEASADGLAAAAEVLKQKLAASEAKRSELEMEVDHERAAHASLLAETLQLKDDAAAAEAELKALRADLSAAHAELAQPKPSPHAHAALEEARSEISNLKAATLRAADELAKATARAEVAEAAVVEGGEEIQTLRVAQASLLAENLELKDQLKDLLVSVEEADALRAEAEAASASTSRAEEVASLRAALEARDATVDALSKSIIVRSKEADASTRSLIAAQEALAGLQAGGGAERVGALEAEVTSLREGGLALKKRADDAECLVSGLKDKILGLSELLLEKEAAIKEAHSKGRGGEELDAALSTARLNLMTKDKEILELRDEVDRERSSRAQLYATTLALEDDVATLRAEAEGARSREAEFEAKRREWEASMALIQNLMDELAVDNVSELSAEIGRRSAEIDRLGAAAASAMAQTKKWKRKVEEMEVKSLLAEGGVQEVAGRGGGVKKSCGGFAILEDKENAPLRKIEAGKDEVVKKRRGLYNPIQMPAHVLED